MKVSGDDDLDKDYLKEDFQIELYFKIFTIAVVFLLIYLEHKMKNTEMETTSDIANFIIELVEEQKLDEQRIADLISDVNRLGLEKEALRKQLVDHTNEVEKECEEAYESEINFLNRLCMHLSEQLNKRDFEIGNQKKLVTHYEFLVKLFEKKLAEANQPVKKETRTIRFTCETCNGSGEIDETLGGYSFSVRHAKCPDCNGNGHWEKKDQTIDDIVADREDLRLACNTICVVASDAEEEVEYWKNKATEALNELKTVKPSHAYVFGDGDYMIQAEHDHHKFPNIQIRYASEAEKTTMQVGDIYDSLEPIDPNETLIQITFANVEGLDAL